MREDAQGMSFINDIPKHLNNIGEHNYSGEILITGNLGGLKVSLTNSCLKIKDSSLCKWYLGDNFKTMGRSDTQRAIEKLSDILHLPMGKAIVTRIDIAQNFITQHKPVVYISRLGMMKYAIRLQEPNGVYYIKNGGRLCFYDKNIEQRNKRCNIPQLYKGRNVLRYEQRYTERIAKQFKFETITGGLLYDEDFYIGLLNRWENAYQAIEKINDKLLISNDVKTKKQFYRMTVQAFIESAGGELKVYEQIRDSQNRGELTSKQAYDIREIIRKACEVRNMFAVPNEAIEELNKKVKEAVKYYR